MMGITYATTAAKPGDTFPVLIRKMAQKLGVSVDVGDNVYRVMWNILADLDWTFGTSQSHVNVANQNVTYVTTPAQGDTLNVLFLKFAQRTGYVIIVRNGRAVPLSHKVLTDVILDPENPVGGGGETPTPPEGGTGIFYTLTYVNDYGTITGVNPQLVEGNLSGTAVTAVIGAAMEVSFVQWDDGNDSPVRTDTVIADATYTVEVNELSFAGPTSSDPGTAHSPGDDLEDDPTGGTSGWWGPWVVERDRYIVLDDTFDTKVLGSDIDGQQIEYVRDATDLLENSDYLWTVYDDTTDHTTGAFSFDGTATNRFFGGAATTDPTEFSIAAWVRLPSVATDRNVICRSSTNPATQWSHLIDFDSGSGVFRGYVYSGAANSVLSDTVVVVDTWYHVVVTAKQSDFIRIYINGTEEGTPTATGAAFWTSGDSWWVAAQTGDASALVGDLYGIAVWNKQLTAGEAATLAAGDQDTPASVQAADLVFACPMSDNDPGDTIDKDWIDSAEAAVQIRVGTPTVVAR